MSIRRPPRAAQALLHHLGSRHRESLEGDLLEEFAAGRSRVWYCRQVLAAVHERLCCIIRQQMATFVAATTFFVVSLWIIAPATYRIMSWARSIESLQALVLLGWLAGVPFVLGGVAGVAERRRRFGAILLGAAVAWFTPITLPFTSAACDLCTRSASPSAPNSILFLTPLTSALLAGLGAWVMTRFFTATNPERST